MQWSKLKHNIESRFADEIRGRVCIYSTRYTIGSHFMTRGWITVDGTEIANFSTPENVNKYGHFSPEMNERIADSERTPGKAVEKGEFSKYEFVDSCREFLNMNIAEAIKSDNPILVALAILDKRTGKRTLMKFSADTMHPLPAKMLELRLSQS